MVHTQMIKGFIEGFILQALVDTMRSSTEIMEYLKFKGTLDISEGTIYPLMLRLEKDKYVTFERHYNPNGPSIKKYIITELGYKELKKIKEYWKSFKKISLALLEDQE